MTRDEWIERFAAQAQVPAPDPREVEQLLALAGVAAHASERTAAPLACWIAGRSKLALSQLGPQAAAIAGGDGPRDDGREAGEARSGAEPA